MNEASSDYQDRFSGIARLYGQAGAARIRQAHVMVIGIGGVGSWTAEALARSGVGRLSLVDFDEICVTNVNRQLHALTDTVGKSKISVMAERLRGINPAIEVTEVPKFFTEASCEALLSEPVDVVVDAIDHVKQKALLIAACVERGIPLVVVGGAGGKVDPSCIAKADLAFATNDLLLKKVRKVLRMTYDFPPEQSRQAFGVRSVFSTENARYPWADGSVACVAEPGSSLRLNCDSGFGSITSVTGSFGFVAAAQALEVIVN